MKVVTPSPLLEEAADLLGPVKDDVVVVGAAALEVALTGTGVLVTPTRDVDVVISTADTDKIVAHLEEAHLSPSDVPHEAGFTWVRGTEFKVQLIRGFHPFPKGASRALPENPAVEVARRAQHREEVSFKTDPEVARLWAANAACLVALKEAAFGRTRPPENEVVKRDFHDVFSLFAHVPGEVLRTYQGADGEVRGRVRRASERMATDEALQYAGNELVELGQATNQRQAEQDITAVVADFQRRLANA